MLALVSYDKVDYIYMRKVLGYYFIHENFSFLTGPDYAQRTENDKQE